MIMQKSPILLYAALILAILTGTCVALPINLGDTNGDNENPHNFSNLYTGSTKSVYAASTGDPRETQICIFCHTPHGATPESTLWSRPSPTTVSFPTYGGVLDIYSIAGAQYTSGVTQPSGASKLCLSCHDGLTAVGTTVNDSLPITMVQDTILDPTKFFENGGRDFALTHPVSFVYTDCLSAGNVCYELNQITPGTFTYPTDPTFLDGNSRMQCTSCHNPHLDTNDGTYSLPFWKVYSGTDTTDYDTVCQQCHTSTPGSGYPPGGDAHGP